MAYKKQKLSTPEKLGISIGGGYLSLAWIESGQAMAGPILKGCFQAPCVQITDGVKILTEWVETNHLKNIDTVFVLEPTKYNLYLLEEPEVEEKELNSALRWRVKDYLDYEIDSAVVDYIPLPGKRTGEGKKMGYAIAVNQKNVDEGVQLIEASGLQVLAIDIAETALRNVGQCIKEHEEGIVYLHIAPKSSQLILIKKGIIYLMRKVDINAQFLFDNKEGDAQKEEIYKERFVNDLVLEVQRSIDYCSSTLRQNPAKKLVIGPLPKNIEDLIAKIQENLGMPVQAADFKEFLQCHKPVSPLDQNRCVYAIGGALRREVVT